MKSWNKKNCLAVSLSFVLAIFLSVCSSEPSTLDIVGGEDRDNPGFFAALFTSDSDIPSCGAVFIEERILLTAAHCVTFASSRLRVLPLVSDRNEHAPLLEVKAVLLHPDWNPKHVQNDIALLFLADEEAVPKRVKTASIASDIAMPEVAPKLEYEIIGWGDVSSHGQWRPQHLQGYRPEILEISLCQDLGDPYHSLSQKQICVGSLEQGGFDSCYGDSGGPLFHIDQAGQATVYGLVSWGRGCAQPGKPGVLSRVAAYRDWIQSARQQYEAKDGDLYQLAQCYERVYDRQVFYQDSAIFMHEAYLGFNPWNYAGEKKESQAAILVDYCQDGDYRITRLENDHNYQPPQYLLNNEIEGLYIERRVTQFCSSSGDEDYDYIFSIRDHTPTAYVVVKEQVYQGVAKDQALDSGELIMACTMNEHNLQFELLAQGQIQVTVSWPDIPGVAQYWLLESGEEQSGIHMRAIKHQDSKSASVTLSNHSHEHLYSWQLVCPFAFELIASDGKLFRSIEQDGSWSLAFFAHKSPLGYLAPAESLSMELRIRDESLPDLEELQCLINNLSQSFSWVLREAEGAFAK